jgi:hypothetical protein
MVVCPVKEVSAECPLKIAGTPSHQVQKPERNGVKKRKNAQKAEAREPSEGQTTDWWESKPTWTSACENHPPGKSLHTLSGPLRCCPHLKAGTSVRSFRGVETRGVHFIYLLRYCGTCLSLYSHQPGMFPFRASGKAIDSPAKPSNRDTKATR